MLRRIGRYEIQALLGRGGCGEVFKAFDPTVSRMVAVKVLTIESDPTAMVRFRNEAASSGRLRHPNIVTIHDFGEQDGTPYIVMELLEGKDLQNVINGKDALEPWQRVQILVNIATGLSHAHAEGIIHRDVKPANVMLLPDGSVKIMDFGIALVSHDASMRLTKTGFVLGTFRYMAPEQYQGEEPDTRSDIFSFGLLAYELLTGKHPFDAKEAVALMYNVVHSDPAPVGRLWPACPPALDRIVARLLEKNPELRYQTLEDFVFDVQPTLGELRHHKAIALFEAAQQAHADGQLKEAQSLVHKALDLDATFSGVRELRERIQQQLRREAVRPHVDEALREGREKMSAGQWQAAVERFGTALRLDPDDTELLALVTEARQGLERVRQRTEMENRASKALRDGDFAAAQQLAHSAIELGSTTAAHRVLKRAEAALEEQRAAAQLGGWLEKVSAFVKAESWMEAQTCATAARAEFPASEELIAFAKQIDGKLAEAAREQRIAAGLATARGYVEAKEWDAAARCLEEFQAEFPALPEATDLLRSARVEIDKRSREEFVSAALRTAREHAAQGAFLEATKTLESALDTAPSEPRLSAALESIAEAQTKAEQQAAETARLAAEAKQRAAREAALKSALTDARSLRTGGKLPEALQTLETFRSTFGSDSAVDNLVRAIADEQAALEQAQRQREVAYQQAIQDAEKLAEENIDGALNAIATLNATFGSRPEAVALKNRLEAERERRKAEESKALANDIEVLLREGKPQEAIRLLGYLRGQEAFSRLHKEATDALQRQANRENAVKAAIADAGKRIAGKDWAGATQVLEECAQAWGADARMEPLRASIEGGLAAQAEAELAAVAERIKAQLNAGDIAGAQQLLQTLPPEQASMPRFAALATALTAAVEQARRVQQELQRAADAAKRAEQEAQRAAAEAQRKEALRLEAIAQREQDRRARIARLDGVIRDGQLDAAERDATGALREWPGDAEFAARVETIAKLRLERELAEQERKRLEQEQRRLEEEKRQLDAKRAALRKTGIEALQTAVAARCQAEDFAGALDLLDRTEWPGTEVDSTRADVLRRQTAALEARISATLAAAEREQPQQAHAMLVALEQEFPARKDIRSALRASEKAIRKTEAAARRASQGPGLDWRKPALAGGIVLVAIALWWALRPTPPVEPSQASVSPAIPSVGVPAPTPATVQPTPQTKSEEPAKTSTAKNVPPVSQPAALKGTPVAGPKAFVPPVVQGSKQPPEATPVVIGESLPGAAPVQTPGALAPPAAIGGLPPPPPPKAPEVAAKSGAPNPVADTSEIRAVLASISAGVTNKQISQIERLWPSNPQLAVWRSQFPNPDYKVTFTIEALTPPEIAGDRATLRARTTDVTTLRLARPDRISKDVTIELQRTNGRWMIVAAR
jgi:hypothetical protein